MLSSVVPIRDQIISVLRFVWDFAEEDRVVPGRATGEETTVPIAFVSIDGVPRSFNGIRSVTESMVYDITGYFPLANRTIPDDLKVEKAALLGDALLAESWSANGGYLPQVIGVTFLDDEVDKKRWGVSVTFSILTDDV